MELKYEGLVGKDPKAKKLEMKSSVEVEPPIVSIDSVSTLIRSKYIMLGCIVYGAV